MNDPAVQRLIDEAMRLQAEDGFPGPTPVGSAWFRLHGLPPVRWVTTERRGHLGGGDAALVMDGHWHQAVTLRGSGGRGVLAFVVLLAEHVQDRPALSALAGLILASGQACLIEQSTEYVQRLVEHQHSYNLRGNTA